MLVVVFVVVVVVAVVQESMHTVGSALSAELRVVTSLLSVHVLFQVRTQYMELDIDEKG